MKLTAVFLPDKSGYTFYGGRFFIITRSSLNMDNENSPGLPFLICHLPLVLMIKLLLWIVECCTDLRWLTPYLNDKQTDKMMQQTQSGAQCKQTKINYCGF